MNKEEIINELNKQNIELGEELSLAKDRLNKEKFEKEHYKKLYSEIKKQKDDVVEYIKKYLHEHIIDDLPDEESKFETEDSIPIPNAKEILLRMLGEIDVED